MKNPMAYVKRRESCKNKMSYFRRFWDKEPRHSENLSLFRRTVNYLYRSVRLLQVMSHRSHPTVGLQLLE